MSATMEGMVGEKRIVPERSEWFRSSGLIGTGSRLLLRRNRGGLAKHQGVMFAGRFCPWVGLCPIFTEQAGENRKQAV
jgi:hypothetical protein